jgi:hypothetical protein
MTSDRKKAIDKLLRENTEEEILKAFDIVSKSNFLNGDNNTGWKASFNWIIKPNKFTDIIEGAYKNKSVSTETNNTESKVIDFGLEEEPLEMDLAYKSKDTKLNQVKFQIE